MVQVIVHISPWEVVVLHIGVRHSLTPMCKTIPPGKDITIILENVEDCRGEPEQADTGILCH